MSEMNSDFILVLMTEHYVHQSIEIALKILSREDPFRTPGEIETLNQRYKIYHQTSQNMISHYENEEKLKDIIPNTKLEWLYGRLVIFNLVDYLLSERRVHSLQRALSLSKKYIGGEILLKELTENPPLNQKIDSISMVFNPHTDRLVLQLLLLAQNEPRHVIKRITLQYPQIPLLTKDQQLLEWINCSR